MGGHRCRIEFAAKRIFSPLTKDRGWTSRRPSGGIRMTTTVQPGDRWRRRARIVLRRILDQDHIPSSKRQWGDGRDREVFRKIKDTGSASGAAPSIAAAGDPAVGQVLRHVDVAANGTPPCWSRSRARHDGTAAVHRLRPDDQRIEVCNPARPTSRLLADETATEQLAAAGLRPGGAGAG